MIFSPELIKKVLDGSKTVTRRRSSRYQVGKVYAIQPGRGKRHIGHIEIKSVKEGPLSKATSWQEARLEGFVGPLDFVLYWEKLHGPIDYSESVTRIAFRLAPSCEECVELGGRE